MNVSLTTELDEYVRSKVDAGSYGSAGEVVEEAVRRMREHEEEVIEELRQKLIEGEQSGIAEDFSFEKLKAKVDAKMSAERNQA